MKTTIRSDKHRIMIGKRLLGAFVVLAMSPIAHARVSEVQTIAGVEGMLEGSNLGFDVAVSGSLAAFAEPRNDAGRVHVYARGGFGIWEQVGETILPPWGDLGLDALGSSLDLDGSRLITGAYGAGPGFTGKAAVWSVDAGSGSIMLEAILEPPAQDAWLFAFYGYSVAISGDTAVVGARNTGAQGGSAYVYERNDADGTWPLKQKLSAADAEGGEFFGHAVAISGSRIVVGAPDDVVAGQDRAGAVYFFHREGDVWTEVTKLTATNPVAGHQLGWAVDIEGDHAVAGAPNPGAVGEAVIYHWTGDAWQEEAGFGGFTVVTDEMGNVFQGGLSVSVSGTRVAVGADGIDGKGAMRLYSRDSGSWMEASVVAASDGNAGDGFGFSVALSGDRIACGAPMVDIGMVDAGAVYLLEHQATVPAWTRQNPFPQFNNLNGVSFADTDNGIAVGDAGTIIATSDGGATWTVRDAGTGEQLRAIEHLDAGTVLAVGGLGTILRSTDGGVSWSPVESGTADYLGALSFVDASTGFALGDGGALLKTADGGLTWTSSQISVPATAFRDLSFVDADTGWVVGFNDDAQSDLILRTTDGGATWTEQATGVWDIIQGVHAFDADNALAIGFGRLLRTTNGGENWEKVAIPVLNDTPLDKIEFLDAIRGYIVGSNNAIFRTDDGGATWVNQVPAGLETSWPGGISFIDPNTVTIVGGNGGDILRTTDGGSAWTRQFRSVFGVPWTAVEGVHFTDADTGTVVSNAGVARTTDGGATWELQASGIVECEWLDDVFFLDADNGYAVGGDCDWRGIVLKTTDGGATWTRRYVGRPIKGVFFTDPQNGIAVGEDGFIATTANGGSSWITRSSGTVNTLNRVAFADANNGIAVGRWGTVRYTTNGGMTWSAASLSPDVWLDDVAFPAPDLAIAVGWDGPNQLILRSTDGGATWSALLDGPQGNVRGVHFSDRLTGTAIAVEIIEQPNGPPVTEGVVLRTRDGGETWTRQESPYDDLRDVFFVDANIGIVVGERGTIFRTTTGGEGEVTPPAALPQLAVGYSDGEVVISWPASFNGLVLQSSGSVGSSAGWMPVAGDPVLRGDRWEYRESIAGMPSSFYRLLRP